MSNENTAVQTILNNSFADGLRAVADFYEQHPEIPAPSDHSVDNFRMDSKEEAAHVVRALGSCKKHYHDDLLTIAKDYGAISMRFVFYRHNVCTRKVVGTKTLPAETIPERTVDLVEWECEPILAESAS